MPEVFIKKVEERLHRIYTDDVPNVDHHAVAEQILRLCQAIIDNGNSKYQLNSDGRWS